ncbi:YjgN family protein [Methylotenera sp. L2L1]|uniref:YjgN family protein n=1 Tax=Methylotenera sp. L2L1 TaxID=1502770 RepID=UPI00056AEEF5|nr:YjgN family protein [Methylotenera sp. L2L1]
MSNRQTPVVFTGRAGEYFGIWIVNLLLSIVTLGIYSAWAKVRRNKYFYNNTLIDSVGFDYHASPIAILKGRIIAVVLFVLYQVFAGFSPIAAGILLVAFLFALPWIVIRGLMFNARNSSHRGLRFDFDGSYLQAALAFIVYPILVVITLGLALPFVAQRVNQFAFNHHKFGLSRFQMQALVKDFYMVYLKLAAVILAISLAIYLGVSSLASHHKHDTVSINQHSLQAQSTATEDGFIKVADTAETQSTADYLKDLSPEDRAEFEAQMKAYEAQIQDTESQSAESHAGEHVKKENPIEKMFGPYAAMLGPMIYAIFLGIALFYMAIIFLVTAYIRSRITNLIWNGTSLEHISFTSNQRMRDLVWLYFSNTIILFLTLGLATPWAQIRMARYRAERLVLTGETDWDKFVGEKKEMSRAMGEEIAEMFDVDLSFG